MLGHNYKINSPYRMVITMWLGGEMTKEYNVGKICLI